MIRDGLRQRRVIFDFFIDFWGGSGDLTELFFVLLLRMYIIDRTK